MALSRQDAFRFVWLIGLVSLFSDMTYQGAHANAGPYLAMLGAGGTVVGVVAGAGEFVNYTLRLLFGYWADKTRAYWLIAFPGYALNLIAVPLLAFTGHWPAAAALLILERTGKGMRTPARDVMLSHAADQVGRGWAFGVHEALDQTGAMLGPLLVALMLFLNKGYHASFGVLAVPAVLALLTLTLTWRLYPKTEDATRKPVELDTHGLPRSYWLLVAGVGFLAMGYTDFALMAFHFKKQMILGSVWIPISYAAAMGLQGLVSLSFGHLYDRWGVKALIAASVPAVLFTPLAFLGGTWVALLGLALWTMGMGAQGSTTQDTDRQSGRDSAMNLALSYGIASLYGGYLCWSALIGWSDHQLPSWR